MFSGPCDVQLFPVALVVVGETIDPYDLVPVDKKRFNEILTDESGAAGDEIAAHYTVVFMRSSDDSTASTTRTT